MCVCMWDGLVHTNRCNKVWTEERAGQGGLLGFILQKHDSSSLWFNFPRRDETMFVEELKFRIYFLKKHSSSWWTSLMSDEFVSVWRLQSGRWCLGAHWDHYYLYVCCKGLGVVLLWCCLIMYGFSAFLSGGQMLYPWPQSNLVSKLREWVCRIKTCLWWRHSAGH